MKNIFKILIAIVCVAFISSCKSEYPNLEKGLYANMSTNRGDILLKLYYKETPLTVANFISLAEGNNQKVNDTLKGKKFYDGLPFHRVIPNFMIQGGDIKRNGSGNPGYKFADEFPKNEEGKLLFKHDKKGILSMANSGPNTNGSQFFITHKETPWLDGRHTVFGIVLEGLPVVDSIIQNDTIKSIKIIRKGSEAKKYDANEAFEMALKAKEEEEKLKEVEKENNRVAFLEKMKKSEAITLPSGLKILHLKKGNETFVKEGDSVKMHYTGYLTHGEIFDSSHKRNETFDFVFGMNRFIKGWSEGLQLIGEGGSARLFIPSNLGYGDRPIGPIPANSDLIFDVEVVKVGK